MNFWSTNNLHRITGGELSPGMAPSRRPASDICPLTIDTRALQPGQIFLAIRGERFDANTLVGEAARQGASLAIADNPQAIPADVPATFPLLIVPDARKALGQIAAAYRTEVLTRTSIIAVCGSNGKTTTVRLIDAVLAQRLKGRASAKSFNNDIGVPLTILSARPTDQYLICEIGTNAPGEVAALGAIVRPDIAVITSIGREHLEKLGSLEGVAREEAAICDFLTPPPHPSNDGPPHKRASIAIISADAPCLADALASLRRPPSTLRFGEAESSDLRLTRISQSPAGIEFDLREGQAIATFSAPLLGRHNASNASAAIAIGRLFALTDAEIAAGLRTARPPEMRLQAHNIRGITIINDAYNANPDSMRAALATMAEIGKPAARRVVILGDMLEMGEHRESGHREVVEAAAALPDLDLLILIGPAMRRAAENPALPARTEVVLMADLDDQRAREAADLLRPGDCVLLKGSRRMRLERILSAASEEPAGAGTLDA